MTKTSPSLIGRSARRLVSEVAPVVPTRLVDRDQQTGHGTEREEVPDTHAVEQIGDEEEAAHQHHR